MSLCIHVVDMLEYMQEAEKRIPTFRGIKYSHLDLTEATQCAVYGDRKYNILWGVDQVRHSLVRLAVLSKKRCTSTDVASTL